MAATESQPRTVTDRWELDKDIQWSPRLTESDSTLTFSGHVVHAATVIMPNRSNGRDRGHDSVSDEMHDQIS